MIDQNSDSEDSVESDKIVASGSVSSQPSNDRRKLFRRLVALAGLGITGVLLSQDKTGLLPKVEATAVTTGTSNATGSVGWWDGAADIRSDLSGRFIWDATLGLQSTATNTGIQGHSSAGTGVVGDTEGSGGAGVLGKALNAGAVSILAQGFTGQTMDLQEWIDVSNNVLSAVHADGSLTLGSSSLALVTPIAAFGQQGAWERDTSDGNGFQFSWVKTRGGAACQANDSIGDLAFDFMNTTPTLVQGAVQRGIVTNPTAGSESTGFQFYCMNSGSMGLRVQITSNGNVLASGFVNTSDMRFKEDIQPIENALDKITRLNGVYFKWNQEYRERLKRSDSQTRQVGLIAQQVRDVIPEIVAKMRDGEAGDYLAVDYSRLVAIMIEATKELAARNNEQQTEMQRLYERIAALEQKIN